MYLIYGKGKVGNALVALCEHQGIPCEIRDDSDSLDSFELYDAIIPSPGIPSHHPVYATGKVISELDFAAQYLPQSFQTIAITGTDGKSTTSWILYSILEKIYFGKKSTYLSGNFDIPFSSTVLSILERGDTEGIVVLEISSFMSYFIGKSQNIESTFAPDYTIFTNFKPDHLNWHRDLQDYLDAKMNLINRTRKTAIISSQVIEFAEVNHLLIQPLGNMSTFPSLGACIEEETIVLRGESVYSLDEGNFPGRHNAMNILSVLLIIEAMGAWEKGVIDILRSIPALPHRLQKVGEKDGIIFIEDSKSTSAQSLEAALGSYGNTKNLLLIVGGSDKGDRFDMLTPHFRKRVKALVAIGATKNAFIQIADSENIPYLATDILSDGVQWLFHEGEPGDVLMLSPGCASFGLFRDYLDRADQFRAILKTLP